MHTQHDPYTRSCSPVAVDSAMEAAMAQMKFSLDCARQSHEIGGLISRLSRRANSLVPPASSPRNTMQACDLMRTLAVGVNRLRPDLARGISVESTERVEIQRTQLRIRDLVPHRNGLMDPSGKAFIMERQTNLDWGLFKCVTELGLSSLALPACRMPSDLELPLGTGFKLDSCGGVSYASTGLLRPMAMEPISAVLGTADDGRFMVFSVLDIVVLNLSLPTPGKPSQDEVWGDVLASGAKAAADIATMMRTSKVLWVGDFNFQPLEANSGEDPRSKRRSAWNKTNARTI